mgnify:CR=1 FL=1
MSDINNKEPKQKFSSSLPDWITGRDPLYTYEVESTLMKNGINHRRIYRKVRIAKPEVVVRTRQKKEKPLFIKIE